MSNRGSEIEKSFNQALPFPLQADLELPPVRLFQASNASGKFEVNEIVEFAQVDLVPDDVFILDAYNNVYVWVGEDARPEEKTMAMDAAIVSNGCHGDVTSLRASLCSTLGGCKMSMLHTHTNSRQRLK